MKLQQLQQNFIALLHNEANTIGTEVVAGGRIDVATRLHIYHHGYRARLLEVLQDVFEHSWGYLGDDAFNEQASGFIESQSSTYRTLNRYGDGFPKYLASQFPKDAEIAEIAQLDWMMRCAFDGANATPLTVNDLARIAPAQWAHLGFKFHPTLTLHTFSYNAASIWDALDHNQAPSPAQALAEIATIVVWRRDVRPHFMTVDALQAKAISLLQGGASFAASCEQLQVTFPKMDVVPALGVAMRSWLDNEMLVAIT